MRKKAKQILRKSLCGILCAAMLFSGISVPEFSAKAAEIEIIEETEKTEETENKEENSSREASDKSQESASSEEKETAEKKEDVSSEELKEPEDKADENASREDEGTEETKQSSAVEDEKTEETETRGVEGSTKEETDTSESTGTQVETVEESTEEISDSNLNENTINAEISNFYYYIGDVKDGEKVGLYYYDNAGSIITLPDITSNNRESWTVYSKDTAYSMTAVTEYAGWYSIPVVVADNTSSAGIQVFRSTDIQNPLIKIDPWNNEGMYKILSTGKNCAVKNEKSFSDEVTTVMRNITLYAYSQDGIPVITTKSELSYINEETGEQKFLTSNYQDEWSNYYYHMEQDSDINWYYLQFSAPLPGKDNLICDFYIKDNNSDNKYTWKTKFIDGSAEYATDFAPAFQGNVYYKDGIFYDSKSTGADETIEQVKLI